jgi:hypothetical protein
LVTEFLKPEHQWFLGRLYAAGHSRPEKSAKSKFFLHLLQPVIVFLKHTPRPTVPYGHLSITYHHVPEACTLLYSPWTKVHTALTMFNGSLGAFHN